MTNCSQETAKRGWAVFNESETPPTLVRLNEALLAEGHGAVSERMYKHYRRLKRSELADYVPINELDVIMKLQSAG